ncbi:hypothetical protein VDG1235_543 [Verrucomicrobiia bacterium DG1235]|nr:hypothetical protein VDG1235_543 [Verrucomicrobiae bacterium DG1235]
MSENKLREPLETSRFGQIKPLELFSNLHLNFKPKLGV